MYCSDISCYIETFHKTHVDIQIASCWGLFIAVNFGTKVCKFTATEYMLQVSVIALLDLLIIGIGSEDRLSVKPYYRLNVTPEN